MSSAYIIACRTCGSYQTEKLADPKLRFGPYQSAEAGRYLCALCGDEFQVADPAEYVRQHPPNPRRCMRCDKEGVELVERNHRYAHQPRGEIVDLYKCSFCGLEIQNMVQRSPDVLYD
jgi:DNA-directed RNA polymerase subunit RPC12/RpoP